MMAFFEACRGRPPSAPSSPWRHHPAALLAVAGLGVGLAGQRIDGVGITVAVLVTALVLQELAQQLHRAARQLLAVVGQPGGPSSGFFL